MRLQFMVVLIVFESSFTKSKEVIITETIFKDDLAVAVNFMFISVVLDWKLIESRHHESKAGGKSYLSRFSLDHAQWVKRCMLI